MGELRLGGLIDGQRRTTHEFVRDTLRQAIVTGLLAGGTRLVQADIAVQLSVSTTPVREALRDLAAEGLIQMDPHRGAVVHELDVDELRELYDIRLALEPLAVRKAAELISDSQLAEAGAIQRQMDAEADPSAWVALNAEFHSTLERAANAPRLTGLVKSVQDAATQYVGHVVQVDPTRIAAGNQEHRQLLDALAARDGNSAGTILYDHLRGTLVAILAANSLGRADDARDQPKSNQSNGRLAPSKGAKGATSSGLA